MEYRQYNLAGYYFSVAVGVAFIALAGITVETGVVMILYIDNQVMENKPGTRKSMTIKPLIVASSISLISSISMAMDKGSMNGHDKMDHGAMNHSNSHSEMDHSKMGHGMESHADKAMGTGVIHSISRLNKMVNLTHEPIPALNWPEMTMDLPVAKSINLGHFKAGDKVTFHLELGDDKKYIITDMKK